MKNILIIYCCIFFTQIYSFGQELTFSEKIQSLLTRTQIDILTPLDTDYRTIKVIERLANFQSYDYAIRSKKEKLEIRYLFQPLDTTKLFYFPPNANFMRMVTHLASNEDADDNVIAVHSMANDDLGEIFNADWGREVLFTPKEQFSARSHCKMLMLHKEGVGDVFVFFLFDFPNASWERRYHAVRFTEIEE